MNLQRINVKLFVDAPAVVRLDAFLSIFARWRENKKDPSEWVDMADYAHVPKGPGIMIIGHQGNLALDLADPGPGILYANKKGLNGNHETRVLNTFGRALALARALTEEPEYPARLSPRPSFWQLTFNDRMNTPNTDQTDSELGAAILRALDRIFGRDQYTRVREKDPLLRYGFVIHSDRVDNLDTIASKL
jgi:hypothetical protein